MLRKDREQTDQAFFDGVLSDAQEIFVAFNHNPAPYIIALNFVHLSGKIYMHCAQEGQKLDCIKANAHVGFSAVADVEILPEKATTAYRSISGTGKAYIVEDISEKIYALDALALRYMANCEMPTPAKMLMRTAVIRIDIENITGKHSKKKAN